MSTDRSCYNYEIQWQQMSTPWTDTYVEIHLQSQMFPNMDPASVFYGTSTGQFTVSSNFLNPSIDDHQHFRSLTPQPVSNRAGPLLHLRPTTPQPASSSVMIQAPESGQVVPSQAQMTQEMVQRAKMFRDAVAEYKKVSKIAISLDLDKPSTWEDLLLDVKTIEETYKSGKTTGTFTTMLRRGFRNMARCEAGVQSWLRLIPGDSWQASVVVGGLRIIFDAAAKLDLMREETYLIIEQIPQTLENADRLIRYYANADSLHLYVSQLYLSIIDTLSLIIEWYQQSSARHAISAMTKGSGYGRRLRECLERLQQVGEAVTKQGNLEMHGQIHNMASTLNDVSGNVFQNQNLLTLMCNSLNSQTDILRDQELVFNTLITELRAIQLEREEERKRKLQAQIDQQQRNVMRRAHLLALVGYDPDLALEDLQRVLQTGLAFDRTQQGFAASILHSEQVGIWLSTKVFVPLVINAHSIHHDRISSISLFSCMLIRLLGKLNSGVVLTWCCGLHTEDNDCHFMLLNFTGQLLCSASFEANILDSNFELLAQALHQNSQDVASLATVLCMLIKSQLAYSQVTMVIDSASFYEGHVFYQDMMIALQVLSRLCQESTASTNAFKLLVTSPKTLNELGDMMQGVSGVETLDLAPLRFQNASTYRSTMQDVLA